MGEDIQPYYAVKCNPEPTFLRTLAALGVAFDCASRGEAAAVLSLGVPPRRILYANPCKSKSHLEFAAQAGITLSTFDSTNEIHKVLETHPRCELLLRIRPPDEGDAVCPLGSKYGALEDEIPPLLAAAKAAGVSVVGVSLNLGSPVRRPAAYRSAIAAARAVFDMAERAGLARLRVLDVGGGFVSGEQFEEAGSVIKSAIRDYFSEISDLAVIAEPGRFFAESPFTFAANVIGKRVRGERREYWINDGIYGSMSCLIHDKAQLMAVPLVAGETTDTFASTVFGPTCDSRDTICVDCRLPELDVGDWLVFPNMGAYGAAAASAFNGFAATEIPTHLLRQ